MTSSFVFHLAVLCYTLFQLVYSSQVSVREAIDPTKGFVSVPLNHSNLKIQRPYNVPEDQRYSFKNSVHRLWVFSADKPHSPKSKTKPRTEIRLRGYDYSSGVWQFEAYGYVPQGTSGVCIMQVFGASDHATTLALIVHESSLSYYRRAIIIPRVYNKWFKLNVVHDVDNSKVMVYINGKLKYTAPGRGGTSHFFKVGVYAQSDGSHYMESRWKDIKIYKKM